MSQSGGAIRIAEALVAARHADSWALACRRPRGGAGSLVTALTDVRLAGPGSVEHRAGRLHDEELPTAKQSVLGGV